MTELIQQLAAPENLLAAWRAVRGNISKKRRQQSKGSDGVTLAEFERDLPAQINILSESLVSGRYQPSPPMRFSIPKPNGGKRELAVLSVADRVAQRAAQQVLEPIWEAEFLPCSYGFRPNLSIQQAVQAARKLRAVDFHWVVDGDIEACFNNLDHDLLMKLIQRKVSDRRVLSLLQMWLDNGILSGGLPQDAALNADPNNKNRPHWIQEGVDWLLNTLAEEVDPGSRYEFEDNDPQSFSYEGEEASHWNRDYQEQQARRTRQRAIRRLATSGAVLGLGLLKPKLGSLGSTVQQKMHTPGGRRMLKTGAAAAGGLAALAAGSAAAAYLLNRRAGPVPAGVLQGSPLSPLLANIYLHPFDCMMTSHHRRMLRYADDWVIFCANRESAESAYNEAVVALNKLHLRPNSEKTHILKPEQVLNWLGCDIR